MIVCKTILSYFEDNFDNEDNFCVLRGAWVRPYRYVVFVVKVVFFHLPKPFSP